VIAGTLVGMSGRLTSVGFGGGWLVEVGSTVARRKRIDMKGRECFNAQFFGFNFLVWVY